MNVTILAVEKLNDNHVNIILLHNDKECVIESMIPDLEDGTDWLILCDDKNLDEPSLRHLVKYIHHECSEIPIEFFEEEEDLTESEMNSITVCIDNYFKND